MTVIQRDVSGSVVLDEVIENSASIRHSDWRARPRFAL